MTIKAWTGGSVPRRGIVLADTLRGRIYRYYVRMMDLDPIAGIVDRRAMAVLVPESHGVHQRRRLADAGHADMGERP